MEIKYWYYCCFSFFKHGIEIITDPDDLADFVLSVATGKVDKNKIADYLQSKTKPIHSENLGRTE